jgi:riboflavin biosynthesis pyrimidine reductase
MVNALTANREAHWWNCSPTAALDRGIKKFGNNVLVEGGANFIFGLISARSLDGIFLSVTPERGGEGKIDYQELLAKFSEVSSREVDGTHFFVARNLKA